MPVLGIVMTLPVITTGSPVILRVIVEYLEFQFIMSI